MRGFVSVNDWHLDIHENDVWFWVRWVWRVSCDEVIKCFFAVPYCRYDETKLSNSFQGDLLVDGTEAVSIHIPMR